MDSVETQSESRNSGLKRCAYGFSNYSLFSWMMGILCFTCLLMLMSFIARDAEIPPCADDDSCNEGTKPKYDGMITDQCPLFCTTHDCLTTASYVISLMDESVDPCDDFYAYACGNHESSSSSVFISASHFSKNIIDMIENIPNEGPREDIRPTMLKIRRIYETCIDLDKNEALALPTLLRIINDIGITKWPNLDANFTISRLEDTLSSLLLYGGYKFFDLERKTDPEDLNGGHFTVMVISEIQPLIFKIPSQGERFNREVDRMRATDALSEFVAREEAEIIMDGITEFEENLEIIVRTSQERIKENSSQVQIDITHAQDESLKLWISIIKKYINSTGNWEKYPNIRVVMEDKVYFEKLNDLLSRTSPRILGHAFAMQLVAKNMMYLNSAFKAIYFKYLDPPLVGFSDFNLPTVGVPQTCIFWLMNNFPLVLASHYFEVEFNKELLKEKNELLRIVNNTMISMILNSSWLNEDFKYTMERRMGNMEMHLDEFLALISNTSLIEECYSQLQVTDEDFLSNALSFQRFAKEKVQFLPDCWVKIFHSSMHNPFLHEAALRFDTDAEEVVVIFTIAFLQFPFTAQNRPRYLNLGTFGFVVAHEFGHLLEKSIRMHSSLTENKTLAKFKAENRCLINQYSEFMIDELNVKVNGFQTLDENFADQIGIVNSIRSLEEHRSESSFKQRLPGLDLNQEQLMFLSYSQINCDSKDLQTIEYLSKNDVHSLGKFRVIGPLQNLEAFSKAFNCPEGSFMNPRKKCNFLA